MSSLMQELGRLCRYQKIDTVGDYTKLPYALVGKCVIKKLRDALIRGSSFYCVDLELDKRCRQKKKTKAQSEPHSSTTDTDTDSDDVEYLPRAKGLQALQHYDSMNGEKKDVNRLLLQAEPQVGKTGVFLKVISILRRTIEGVNSSQSLEQEFMDFGGSSVFFIYHVSSS